MFDLEAEIRDWRARLTENLRDEDLDELQGHLTEEITQLRAKGLSTEESFVIAARRLGGERELCGEFAKVHPGAAATRQFEWMIIGFLGFSLSLAAFRTLSLLAVWVPIRWEWHHTSAVGLLGLVQAAGLAALIFVLVRMGRGTLPSGRRLLTQGALLALAYLVVHFSVTAMLARTVGARALGSAHLKILPGVYYSWATAILVPWMVIRLGHAKSRPGHTA